MNRIVIEPASATVESSSLSEPSKQHGSEVLNNGVPQKGYPDSDDKHLQLTLQKLQKRLRERLNSCPTPGNGVHNWLFRTAWRLHEWFSEDEIVELLQQNLSCERPEREVHEAVVNAGKYFRGEMGSSSQKQWPAVDYALIDKIVVNCPVGLRDLPNISPVDLSTEEPRTEEILDVLFPGNPLLCFGRTPSVFWTHPREFWRGRESDFSFIVPNPMTKEIGMTADGKESRRCLDNTGPRTFVVIEFDITDNGPWAPYVQGWQVRCITTLDANVALIIELATNGLPRLPLALAVHSGGKSVHAWFPCAGLSEEQTRPFMERAVRLGADRATWTRCQLVRMPDGMRDNGSRQQVHYFAPNVLGLQGGAK
jgi:hypothetical protein